jgi:hypothetical protein
MTDPKLPPGWPVRLNDNQMADLATKLKQWLKSIDHADKSGNVRLDAESVKALKKLLEPILNKIQYVRVESLGMHWRH